MSFRKKIDMILEARKLEKLSINKIERMLDVDGTIYKAHKADKYPVDSELVRKMIGMLGIRQQWWDKDWESGSTDIFITPVQKGSDNTEIPAGVNLDERSRDLYKVASKDTYYAFLPKTILEGEYRIELKSEIQQRTHLQKDALEAYKKLVKKLEDEIADLRSGKIPIVITTAERAK